jgi:multicomponent Na+:H+ antiporter subunit G
MTFDVIDTYIVATLVIAGVFFNLVTAIGVVRLPDVYTRMHASTKAGTLGVGCIILGVAFHFQSLATAAQAFLVIAFMFLTAPIAGHLIGRAAYFFGSPKWDRTKYDDLEDKYDHETHELKPMRFVEPEEEPARRVA